MGYYHKDNILLDGLIYCLLLGGMVLIFLLPRVIFKMEPTDFSCIRSSEGVECILIRKSQFLKPTEIKIHNPVMVDINNCHREDILGKDYYDPDCYGSSSAEIRSKGVSYKINIYGGYDSHKVNTVARDINEFLLSSNAPSFHKRF
jgi:hypothetical protein